MADITLKLLWYKLQEGYTNMAAALSKGTSAGGGGMFSFGSFDVLDILLLIWVVVGVGIYVIGVLLPKYFKTKSDQKLQNVMFLPPPRAYSPEQAAYSLRRKESYVVGHGVTVESADWLNEFLDWFYHHSRNNRTPDFVGAWIKSLNDHARQELGGELEIVFDRLQSSTASPKIHNVQTQSSGQDSLIVQCAAEVENVNFAVVAQEQTNSGSKKSQYDIKLDRLVGQVNFRFGFMESDLHVTMLFVEKPEVYVTSTLKGSQHPGDQISPIKVEELVKKVISLAVTTMNLTGSHDFPSKPHPLFETLNHVTKQTVMHSEAVPSLVSASPSSAPSRGKHLLVKVIKANGLGAITGCVDPYCVVELDEPPRKFVTSVIRNTVNPFWDEHFLFDLNDNSKDLKLELFDRDKNTGQDFLGRSVLSLKDLRNSPTQRHIVDMASRPDKQDEVSGTATIEVAFMEGDIQLSSPQTTTLTQQDLSGDYVTKTTTTTLKQLPGEDVGSPADAALRDLESGNEPRTPTKTSTLTITGVMKTPSQLELDHDGTTEPGAVDDQQNRPASTDRGRSRERSSFMDTLKKKLSFQKKRSHSYSGWEDERPTKERDASLNRHNPQQLSLPTSRRGSNKSGSLLEVPGMRSADTSSQGSIMTYVTENSTLVIETTEKDKSHRYYLIPNNVAKDGLSKLKIKGTKLHVYNDHCFVASHFPASTACQICSKTIPRRIGRQGYQCRDCKIVCHKHCHHKTELDCPSSNVPNMEMVYVEPPPEAQKSEKQLAKERAEMEKEVEKQRKQDEELRRKEEREAERKVLQQKRDAEREAARVQKEREKAEKEAAKERAKIEKELEKRRKDEEKKATTS